MKPKIAETPPGGDDARIIERPDGLFYWQAKDGAHEYGPFATLLETTQDMQAAGDEAPEPGESLQEAEAEIGIADWIDPDTGEPAEQEIARIEEH